MASRGFAGLKAAFTLGTCLPLVRSPALASLDPIAADRQDVAFGV